MRDRPNLDYDPGPVGASFSRLGPPVDAVTPANRELGHHLVLPLASPAPHRGRESDWSERKGPVVGP
jgi:hypothetical protein